MMLDTRLAYPVRGPRRESAMVVGWTLGFLVVALGRLGPLGALLAVGPALVLLGYVERILERTSRGDDSLPAIRPVFGLLRRGIRLGVVTVAYAAVPAATLLVVQPILLGTARESASSGNGVLFLAASTGLLLVGGLFGYLFPAAAVAVVRTDALRSMVAIGPVTSTAARLEYLVTWTMAALCFGFTASLAIVLLRADLRGGLVAIPLAVYATYASAHLVASACERVAPSDRQ